MNSLHSPKFSHRMVRIVCAFGATLATPGPAWAEEGVWTFDSPPARALQARYGFTPSVEWFGCTCLSAVRLGGDRVQFMSRQWARA